MNRYVKFIIPGVLLLVLGIWLFFFAYGNPDYSKTIMLSHDYPLYEYQGGLAEYCPTDGSSRKVVELTFKKRNHRVMKIWYEQNDDNTITVLDNLEWDSDKVQF